MGESQRALNLGGTYGLNDRGEGRRLSDVGVRPKDERPDRKVAPKQPPRGALPRGPVLLVTGTRRGRRDAALWLDRFSAKNGLPEFVFVGCEPNGVDKQVREWCRARGVVCFSALATWEASGPKAGPERNAALVAVVSKAFPDAICLALPDAKSVGTIDCRDRAKAAGLVTHTLPLISAGEKGGA